MSERFDKCNIVAEIGCVHLGDMSRAKQLISLASFAGADYVKLQKRNPDESTPEHMKHRPHPNHKFSYGDTYLEHRKNLELTIEQHAELKEYCKENKIGYSTSVWDMTSAKEVVGLNPDFIKIPSACNLDFDMIDFILSEYRGDLHISTGMTTSPERAEILRCIKRIDPTGKRLVLYHCTSAYPCPFENLYLLEIERIEGTVYNYNLTDAALGFSNHGYGIASDMAAYMLGARWIERHFVDDRTIPHTDAAASLEPDGLRKLCRNMTDIVRALQRKPKQMDDLEMEQRLKLKILDD